MRISIPYRRVAGMCFALCVVSAHEVLAQSVADILARYYQTMGGIERLASWQTLFADGTYVLATQGGTEVPVRAWYRAPDKKRYEMSHAAGATAVYAFDGENAWFCDPSNGVSAPTLMPDDQARQTRNNADEYPFIDYAAKGHHVELVGPEEFEGRQVFRIKLTRNNGAESYHLFDAGSGREVKIIISAEQGGREVLYETVLRNFRSVGGIELPFLAESWVDGQLLRRLQMLRVEVDTPLDDSLFVFPDRGRDQSLTPRRDLR